jgi:hypothetical protein
MAGGPRKTVFSTLAKTADRKEDRRIKQDTRSILIVLFTPREVRIKVLKQRRLTSNQKFCSRTSSISVESSYHQSEIFTKVARTIFWLCLSDLDRSTAGYGRYSGFSDPGFWVGALSLRLGGCFPLIAPSIVDRLALANAKHNKTVDSNPTNNA